MNSCTHDARNCGTSIVPFGMIQRVSACAPTKVGSDVTERDATFNPRMPGAPALVLLVSAKPRCHSCDGSTATNGVMP